MPTLDLPPLAPQDLAILVVWETADLYAWDEGAHRILLRICQPFLAGRPHAHWTEARQVAEGMAVALIAGCPVRRLEKAADSLARRAKVIIPDTIDGFVAWECRGRRAVGERR